jgi:hypothetical protein
MVKRTSTLIFVVLLLVTLAAGVLAEVQAAPAAQPRGVSDDNCAVTAFDIAGQGTGYIQGTSGGGLPPGLQRNQMILPTDATLQIVRTIGPVDAAILVIDDFFEYGDGIAHGRLVTDLLLAMIQANPIYAAAPQQIAARNQPVVWSFAPSGYGRLLVVEVDTEDYNTDDLRDQVANAVTLVQNTYGVNRIVLNMSFVLVPCTTPEYDLHIMRQNRQAGVSLRPVLLTEVAQSRGAAVNLERAPADVATAALADNAATRDLVTTVASYASQTSQRSMNDNDPTALDPLHEYIKTLTGVGQYWNPSGNLVVVAVGSAGNFGRSLDSLVPGAWPEVASISASIGPTIPWVSSNKGQVMLPGGLYVLGDGYLIGTSFSAPLFSMNMAYYLTNSTLCSDPPLMLDLTGFPDNPIARAVNARCNPVFAAPGR